MAVDSTPSRRVPHAVTRWTRAVIAGSHSPVDPRTLTLWGRTIGVSTSWLRTWCYCAGTKPSNSLDLVRVMRLASDCERTGTVDLLNVFDVADLRTIRALLHRGDVAEMFGTGSAIRTVEFLRTQKYVRAPSLVDVLLQDLDRPPSDHALGMGIGRIGV